MTSAAISASRAKAFETLELPPGADRKTVRGAFRRLVFYCHPDLHGSLPEMAREFQKLVQAYRIAAESAPEPPDDDSPAFAPPPGQPPASPKASSLGRNLHYRLRLDFTQAALGGEISLRYERRTSCPACGDAGTEGVSKKTCAVCKGENRVKETALVEVRVPPGVEDGEILRIRGAGEEATSGGAAGDLHILISQRGHPALKRRGLDVHSEIKLPADRLDEGGPVRIDTIHGPRRINIPPGTAPGIMLILSGCGVHPHPDDPREAGDHLVRIGALQPESFARSLRLAYAEVESSAAQASLHQVEGGI